MKNRAVQHMLAIQYNVDPERVEVEFLYCIGSEYVFKVIVNLPDDIPISKTRKELIVKVESSYSMGDNYNEDYPIL
jgi:hypothetical protein